jgi:hypothetical protein
MKDGSYVGARASRAAGLHINIQVIKLVVFFLAPCGGSRSISAILGCVISLLSIT